MRINCRGLNKKWNIGEVSDSKCLGRKKKGRKGGEMAIAGNRLVPRGKTCLKGKDLT